MTEGPAPTTSSRSTDTSLPTPTATPTTTTSTSTAPVPASTTIGSWSGSGLLVTAVLSGAVLAALITATINVWLTRRKSREDERNRARSSFADAFAAYSAYKELPYAIRRRRADIPGEERIRLSEALREIQANLAYHLAWTAIESKTAGDAYADLIQQVRTTAGSAMREAWNTPPSDTDTAMNIPPSVIDLSTLKPFETTYINAVQQHLKKMAPWWAR